MLRPLRPLAASILISATTAACCFAIILVALPSAYTVERPSGTLIKNEHVSLTDRAKLAAIPSVCLGIIVGVILVARAINRDSTNAKLPRSRT